jgi:hypothetical protein
MQVVKNDSSLFFFFFFFLICYELGLLLCSKSELIWILLYVLDESLADTCGCAGNALTELDRCSVAISVSRLVWMYVRVLLLWSDPPSKKSYRKMYVRVYLCYVVVFSFRPCKGPITHLRDLEND